MTEAVQALVFQALICARIGLAALGADAGLVRPRCSLADKSVFANATPYPPKPTHRILRWPHTPLAPRSISSNDNHDTSSAYDVSSSDHNFICSCDLTLASDPSISSYRVVLDHLHHYEKSTDTAMGYGASILIGTSQ